MSRAPRRPALAVALVLALGCAGSPPRPPPAGTPAAGALAPPAGPRRAARAGLDALLRGDERTARAKLAAGARDGDPWAHLGQALLARRALAPGEELRALVAAVAAAPGHALAPLALRRLEALAADGGDRAAAVEAGLAPLLDGGRLSGLAAYRARVARIRAADATGDAGTLARLRGENGSVDRWALAGPFSGYHALDFDRPFEPEAGTWPASVPAPAALPARETRVVETPDGSLALEGEPPGDDVHYLAVDADLARGGRYVVSLGTTGSAKLLVDGALVAERRAFARHDPTLAQQEVELAPGPHRLLVKLARGTSRGAVHVALSRADGTPSDATYRAPAPGPAPAARPVRAVPLGGPRPLADLVAAAGSPAGAILAGRELLGFDREAAKGFLDAAVALAPRSALARAARAELVAEDPTLDDGVARARAEGDLRAALGADPADGAARLALAELLLRAQRLDDAEAVLADAPAALAGRPALLLARARLAEARGLAEAAARLADDAVAAGEGCAAERLALELAVRRDALARADALAGGLVRCPGGRERLAAHRSGRGDPRGALEALGPLAAARPWSVELAFARAAAELAAGAPARAVETLVALRATWPRSTRVAKRLADALELAGDAAGARAERERALLLDGSDLALRRALALEDGPEVLAELAEDARAAIRAYEAAPHATRPRDASTAMVLDAAAIEVHPSGDATERVHQVIHVLDQAGVDDQGEVTVPAGAELVALRTVKPDGRVLEPDAAGAAKGSHSLTGLAPGDYVQVEYVRGVGAHPRDGWAGDPFYFQVAGTSLFRSSYVVRAPRGLGLDVDAKGMEKPAVAAEGGRDVVRALRTRVPAVIPEPGAPPLAESLPFLQVGVGGGPEVFARAVADGLAERARPTAELRRFAAEIRAGAGASPAPEALVRAAHAAVAKRILGAGGGFGFGEDASAVLSRGRGTRIQVLRAVLAELGARVRLVLVRPFTADPRPYRFPGPEQWNQLLLRAELGGQTFWLDPSQRGAPFGALHPGVLDCDALVLPEPGEAVEAIRTPARALVEDGRALELDLALAADGTATFAGVDRYEGWAAGVVRSALERADAEERRRMVEGMLSRTFRGLEVAEVAVEAEDEPSRPLVVRWKGRVPGLARAAGDGLVLDAPIMPARLGARFVQVASRRTPLLLPQDERMSQRIRIAPPPGLAARAGEAVRLEGELGLFSREERVEAGVLVREERIALRRGRHAPDRYPAVATFAAAVDEVQERAVVLAPP